MAGDSMEVVLNVLPPLCDLQSAERVGGIEIFLNRPKRLSMIGTRSIGAKQSDRRQTDELSRHHPGRNRSGPAFRRRVPRQYYWFFGAPRNYCPRCSRGDDAYGYILAATWTVAMSWKNVSAETVSFSVAPPAIYPTRRGGGRSGCWRGFCDGSRCFQGRRERTG
jgi:hypothetical protein